MGDLDLKTVEMEKLARKIYAELVPIWSGTLSPKQIVDKAFDYAKEFDRHKPK